MTMMGYVILIIGIGMITYSLIYSNPDCRKRNSKIRISGWGICEIGAILHWIGTENYSTFAVCTIFLILNSGIILIDKDGKLDE